MGHSSSIALTVALNNPNQSVVCIDGDGAVFMHLGAMATIGQSGCKNLFHIIINNQAHESVGGMPTTGNQVNFVKVAEACGYAKALRITSSEELAGALKQVSSPHGPSMIEIASAIGSRANLGRPTQSPKENMTEFMTVLKNSEK